MRNETKIGIFVLAGALLFASVIFLLGDFSFRKFYSICVRFDDVAGLPDKAMVKLSGVEVGKVERIYMDDDGRVAVKLGIYEGTKIYRGAKFRIGSTSVIGSKFLQIDQGEKDRGILRDGDKVEGITEVPLDRALAELVDSFRSLVNDINGKNLGENLNQTVSNLRNLTADISQMMSSARPHAENMMERLDSITAKLDSVLAKTDELAAKISRGEGTVGALMTDDKMKKNVSDTVRNLKDATASVKDVLGRITALRTYFSFGSSYEPLIHDSKIDAGLKIYPREGRYYYIGGSNMMNTKNIKRGTNYERINTIDALLGWERGGFDIYGGALNGSGGIGVKYRPFGGLRGLAFLFEGSEFSRRRYIKGRYFNSPRYDAGIEIDINKYIKTGVRINDLAETKRVNYTANLIFEDKDISYLFGLIGFASAGTKARSSSD